MANENLTFKADLLPNSNLEYSLGSSTMQWKINGITNPKLTDTLKELETSNNNGKVIAI